LIAPARTRSRRKRKFNIEVTAAIAIDGILTHKDTCNIVFPHACEAKRGGSKLDRRARR